MTTMQFFLFVGKQCIFLLRALSFHMRQYQKLSKFWQGKNIKTSVFRTCILITQNTEQVLRISELLSVIQNSYIYMVTMAT